MHPDPLVIGLMAAVGVGVLIGLVREHRNSDERALIAGVRTHLIVALGAALATLLNGPVLVAYMVGIGALVAVSHFRTADSDPGMTSEVTLLVTALLAAAAQRHPQLAAGAAVLMAGALFAKRPLHRFAREVVSEREIRDGLLLAAAALVVLPLLPNRPVDPWNSLVPASIWRMVVLIMAVGMAGHIALRVVGARWGLAITGFFAGFASSTAAVIGFGHRARAEPTHAANAAAGALLANLSSTLLLAAVIATASPGLLVHARWPMLAFTVMSAATAALGLIHADPIANAPEEPPPNAFRLSQALMLGAVMAALTLVAAWLRGHFGEGGAVAAAVAVAIVKVHAAGASVGQLHATHSIDDLHATLAFIGLLASSSIAKVVLAFYSGGRGFGMRVGSAVLVSLIVAVAAMLIP